MTESSKVARLIEEYELTGLGDDLEDHWTRTENRYSLRRLADLFNKRLLEAALGTDDTEPLAGEIDNLYELLTSDDVTSGERERARSQIERRGVDVDRLTSDFVSYQSIRTYLKDHRGAEPPTHSSSDAERREAKQSVVQRLTSRLNDVTEQSLRELKRSGALVLGDFAVVVNVRVHCADCCTQMPITELLSEGGCEYESIDP